jgi:hypothetical protein
MHDLLLDFYLEKARAADAHLRDLSGTSVLPDFAGRDDAWAWPDAERPSLITAVTTASAQAEIKSPGSCH